MSSRICKVPQLLYDLFFLGHTISGEDHYQNHSKVISMRTLFKLFTHKSNKRNYSMDPGIYFLMKSNEI